MSCAPSVRAAARPRGDEFLAEGVAPVLDVLGGRGRSAPELHVELTGPGPSSAAAHLREANLLGTTVRGWAGTRRRCSLARCAAARGEIAPSGLDPAPRDQRSGTGWLPERRTQRPLRSRGVANVREIAATTTRGCASGRARAEFANHRARPAELARSPRAERLQSLPHPAKCRLTRQGGVSPQRPFREPYDVGGTRTSRAPPPPSCRWLPRPARRADPPTPRSRNVGNKRREATTRRFPPRARRRSRPPSPRPSASTFDGRRRSPTHPLRGIARATPGYTPLSRRQLPRLAQPTLHEVGHGCRAGRSEGGAPRAPLGPRRIAPRSQ